MKIQFWKLFSLVPFVCFGSASVAQEACVFEVDILSLSGSCTVQDEAKFDGSETDRCDLEILAPDGFHIHPETVKEDKTHRGGNDETRELVAIFATKEQQPNYLLRAVPIGYKQSVACSTGSGVGAKCTVTRSVSAQAVSARCFREGSVFTFE